LGDLLFQIVFLARLAAEKGDYDLVSVIEEITRKMVRRHPHVFGEATLTNAEEVADHWAAIKRKERESTSKVQVSLLSGLPRGLPALLAAHRLSERLSKTRRKPNGREEIGSRVSERCEELGRACRGQDTAMVGERLGALLFDLADLARHWGLNAEHLLREANRAFSDREAEAESR
jgi:MazG family protein